MPVVKPPAPKHTAHVAGNRVILIMPGLRSRDIILVSIGLVILWLAIEFWLTSPIGSLFAPSPYPTDWLMDALYIVAVLLNTLLGAFLLYSLAWQLVGQEVIEATASSLTVSRKLLGTCRTRGYLAQHVKNLRVTSSNMNLDQAVLVLSRLFLSTKDEQGSLAFDYGSATFRFGQGIDEAEAKQVLSEIRQKFPQYGSNDFSHP